MHHKKAIGKAKRGEPTILDIASALGLSHSTVSRALHDHPHINKQTKERVRRAAEKAGYVANSAARLMRSGSSRVVGLIVPDIQNEFYNAAARILAEHCAAHDFRLLLAVSRDDPREEERQVYALREARVAGVLISATANPTQETIQMLAQLCIVQFLRYHPDISGPSVPADDVAGLMTATTHLIDLGHRKIGYVGVSEGLSTGKGRASGFRNAFKAARLIADRSLMRFGPAMPDFGRDAVHDLMSLGAPPSALVVASPRIMLGAIETIEAKGLRVPSDLSIVGYSDSDWFRVWRPPITAVALPVNDMAMTAAQILFRQIAPPASSTTANKVSFESMLKVRGSTSRAPGRISSLDSYSRR